MLDRMAALTGGQRADNPTPSCLYIFYDCEASGGSALRDQVIELAAVVLTDNLGLSPGNKTRLDHTHYSSLCRCETQIQEEARVKHGIDRAALSDQRPVGEVLVELFQWVAERVREVGRLTERQCQPVLVAHGGIAFDFPLLVTEVKRSDCEARFRELELQFADTHILCQQLKSSSDPVLQGTTKLSLPDLKSLHFPTKEGSSEYTPHRALSDALTLRRLFSETQLNQHLNSLELVSTDNLLQRWQSSVDCYQLREKLGLHKQKAKGLVRRGETLRRLEEQFRESDRSEGWLRDHLSGLGVRRPGSTCLQYFRDLL